MKISIIAHPNSRKPRIETDLMGTLHVYVNALPLEGKANRAVEDALSKHFGKLAVLVKGEKSKLKMFDLF